MVYVPTQTEGLQVLDRETYAAGSTIFREGESGSRAYILQSGSVDILKRIDGENVLVGNVGTGGIFGEMALIDNAPRMASAVAADHCVCIIVSEILFQKKLSALDPFLSGVMRVLCENIRSIQDAKLEKHEIDAMIDAEPPVVVVEDSADKAFEIA